MLWEMDPCRIKKIYCKTKYFIRKTIKNVVCNCIIIGVGAPHIQSVTEKSHYHAR